MFDDKRGLELRARRFDQIVGNRHVVEPLRRAIARGKLPRLMLFTGPTGSGKTTICRLLALRLLCKEAPPDQADPCCKSICPVCGNEEIIQRPDTHWNCDEVDASDGKLAAERFDIWRLNDPNFVVFIDEVQELPRRLMLRLRKRVEDRAATIIMATTHQHMLDDALQNRLKSYTYELRRPIPQEVADYLHVEACRLGVKYGSREQLLRVANGYQCEMRPCSKFIGKVLAEAGDGEVTDDYLDLLFPKSSLAEPPRVAQGRPEI